MLPKGRFVWSLRAAGLLLLGSVALGGGERLARGAQNPPAPPPPPPPQASAPPSPLTAQPPPPGGPDDQVSPPGGPGDPGGSLNGVVEMQRNARAQLSQACDRAATVVNEMELRMTEEMTRHEQVMQRLRTEYLRARSL